MVVDYRSANDEIESVLAHVINLEQEAPKIAGATAFFTLDLLHGYWQGPWDDAGRELFTIGIAITLVYSDPCDAGSAQCA